LPLQLVSRVGDIGPAATVIGTWIVRHAQWLIFRFHVNRATNSTSFARLFGFNYSGSICELREVVLGRLPDLLPSQRRYSEWNERWTEGLWLGKSDTSDEHLLAIEVLMPTGEASQKVMPFRSVRRYAAGDNRSWSLEAITRLVPTPWRTDGTEATGKFQLPQRAPKGKLVAPQLPPSKMKLGQQQRHMFGKRPIRMPSVRSTR
jgi:hypothetical protein